MNEWGFIGQGSFMGIGMSNVSFNFGKGPGNVQEER